MHFEVNLDIIPQDLLCFHRFYRRTYEKRQVVFRLFWLIVIALCALYLLRQFFLYPQIGVIRWLGLIYSVWAFCFIVYLLFVRDRFRAKKVLKERKEKSGDVFVSFEDEEICSTAKSAKAQYRYETIEAIWRSRSHSTYYLVLGRRDVIILPERCFTQGDPAAFGAFIAGKTGLEVKEIK